MVCTWAALLSVDSIARFGNSQLLSGHQTCVCVFVWEGLCIFTRLNAHANFTVYGRFESLMHYIRQHYILLHFILFYWQDRCACFNPLNPELNPICYLLALLGAHHFLHVSRIMVKSLTLRLLMSHIYGAPILDVSRSHTTTQHSR